MSRGKFFVIEGMDGSGKTTQISRLQERFSKLNLPVHLTAEPTDGPIGSTIRNVLKKRIKVSPATLAGLFLADRLDHLENDVDGMLKMLDEGRHVVSDRYYWSSYAYHSLDVDMDWVIELNQAAAERLRPDLTFYLDLTADESMARISKNRSSTELFEKKDLLERVRNNYLTAMQKLAGQEKIVTIDASQSPDDMALEIWRHVEAVIKQ